MATKLKYAANEALKVINGLLFQELKLHAFDLPTRTKARLFATGGRYGRQFGIVLGNTDVVTMHHPAQQTKIVLEKCSLPNIPGVEPVAEQVKGSRFKQNDSKIRPGDQISCFVADKTALLALLRWYAN